MTNQIPSYAFFQLVNAPTYQTSPLRRAIDIFSIFSIQGPCLIPMSSEYLKYKGNTQIHAHRERTITQHR